MSFKHGVHGPDVSFYQDAPETERQIDFEKMRAAGASFVIIRAGQNSWEDPDFTWNYKAAKAAGIPRGVYFFYDSRVPPEAQAVLCLSLISGDAPELGVWLDLEENYGGEYGGWQNWKKCLQKLSSRMPFVGIYTAPSYWKTNRPRVFREWDYFKPFPLWIANYGVSVPEIPLPWDMDDCLFWQYGTPSVGEQYGVESVEIDMNWWRGTKEQFVSYFRLTDTPPNEEATMARYTGRAKASATPNVRVRRSYPDGQTESAILPGQAFKGDRVEYTWMHIIEVGGQPITGWSAIHLLEYDDNGETAPEPTPVPPAEGSVTVKVDAEVTFTDATGRVYVGTVSVDGVELVER